MSGYHPDVPKLAAEAFIDDEAVHPHNADAWEEDMRRVLDKIEEAGFMIVDARGSEVITLESEPSPEQVAKADSVLSNILSHSNGPGNEPPITMPPSPVLRVPTWSETIFCGPSLTAGEAADLLGILENWKRPDHLSLPKSVPALIEKLQSIARNKENAS